MEVLGKGNATPEKRKARLGVGAPSYNHLLAGMDVGSLELAKLRAFCKVAVGAANAFEMRKRKSGLFGDRRLRRVDADAALREALAELAKGGAR